MATSSGTTISSDVSYPYPNPLLNSGSEGDLQNLMDERKKKRMLSNRESARRSRKRKQQHLDDLTAQVSQLRKENNQIISSVSITTQHYVSVEAENSVLRAQVTELSNRLQSLNEIIAFMYQPLDTDCGFVDEQYGNGTEFVDELMVNSLSYLCANQPILASADMIQY
ncbi:bZIP transcription factor 11-like protein [Tanacetum coccineum]